MKVGFIGSRNPPSNAQIAWLYSAFESGGIEELHCGQCVGGDPIAYRAAVEVGLAVVIHPPTNPRLLAPDIVKRPGVAFLPAEPFPNLSRNLVGDTDGILALPTSPESDKGNTWYTVHYAEFLNKPVVICFQHGAVEKRGGS
jgi:hypothetical protein